MTRRIFNSMVLVSVFVLLACVVCISSVLYGYFGEIIRDELKEEAHIMVQEVQKDGDYLDGLGYTENRITLVDPEGKVLFDSRADAENMENHKDREEISQAVEKGEAFVTRYSDTLSTKTIYYAVRLQDDSVLRIAQEQSVVVLLLRGIIGPIVLITMMIIIAASIISKRLAGKIVMPVNDIDINDPEIEEPYTELSPLITKIRQQNRHITMQMEELRRKQKEFTTITENMSEGFLLIGRETEILSYNGAALAILGDGETNAPHTAYELNRSAGFRTATEQALSGIHSRQSFEKESRYYHIMANPVMEKNQVAGAVVVIMDVTEKEHRETLRREFTSNVSHELKTPLTTIYGVSDMMAEGIVKESDVRSFGRNIKEESGRMISLIDDIIKLSKLDEDSIPDETAPVDLFDISKEVIDRLSIKAKENNVKLYLEGEHVMIKGVPFLCSEIVYNLCDNAIKYNRENGTVKVSVSREATGNVLLSVEDTGTGISAEDRERIFERFYRGDKSRCRQVDGTGLGLSIVKHAAAHMGGSIRVESTEGKGTRMTVMLPGSVV